MTIIHAAGGLEFHRMDDGTIRVMQQIASFSEGTWCDFVAAMSKEGATVAKIEAVRLLHTRAPK